MGVDPGPAQRVKPGAGGVISSCVGASFRISFDQKLACGFSSAPLSSALISLASKKPAPDLRLFFHHFISLVVLYHLLMLSLRVANRVWRFVVCVCILLPQLGLVLTPINYLKCDWAGKGCSTAITRC